MKAAISIQDRYIPDGRCFGCGPARTDGLGLKSFPAEHGGAVATWSPSPAYEATPGVLNGGVVGTLLDCHTGAALALAVHEREGRWPFLEGPWWATAEYTVSLLKPTPTTGVIKLHAVAVELDSGLAVVEGRIHASDRTTAICRATWKRLRAPAPASSRP